MDTADFLLCMNMVVDALCLAGIVTGISVTALASPEGAYLADHFGFTCSGFLAAADASDPVRLHSYTETIHRLAARKWGSLSDDKLRRLVLAIVTQCETHGRSDFESTAREVIARSGW